MSGFSSYKCSVAALAKPILSEESNSMKVEGRQERTRTRGEIWRDGWLVRLWLQMTFKTGGRVDKGPESHRQFSAGRRSSKTTATRSSTNQNQMTPDPDADNDESSGAECCGGLTHRQGDRQERPMGPEAASWWVFQVPCGLNTTDY